MPIIEECCGNCEYHLHVEIYVSNVDIVDHNDPSNNRTLTAAVGVANYSNLPTPGDWTFTPSGVGSLRLEITNTGSRELCVNGTTVQPSVIHVIESLISDAVVDLEVTCGACP